MKSSRAFSLVPPFAAPAVPKFPIARKPAHEELEQRLAALRQRRKEIHAELDTLVAAAGGPGISPEMRALVSEIEELESAVMRVRHELIPNRLRHLEATRTAFREPRRDAARRALAALAEAEAAIAELNVMSAELRRLGGIHPDMQAAKLLVPLVLPLERLAREKGEAL